MDYLSNMQGMFNRYLREKTGWDEHLKLTRNFICEFISAQRNHEEIIILGSGWLLDIPIEEISAKYQHVYLADIFHPVQVKHKWRNLTNISWIEADLSGGFVNAVYDLVKHSGRITNPDLLNSLDPSPDSGYLSLFRTSDNQNLHSNIHERHYVSVNLLSQLDGMLADYLLSRTRISAELLMPFRKKIQEFHLQSLQKSGPSCLVSDQTEIRHSLTSGTVTEIPLIFVPLPSTSSKKEWNWNFDTSGTYVPDVGVDMKVIAIRF